jgi:hypothetical protein
MRKVVPGHIDAVEEGPPPPVAKLGVDPCQGGKVSRVWSGGCHRDAVDVAGERAKVAKGHRADQVQALHQTGRPGVNRTQVGIDNLSHEGMKGHGAEVWHRTPMAANLAHPAMPSSTIRPAQ